MTAPWRRVAALALLALALIGCAVGPSTADVTLVPARATPSPRPTATLAPPTIVAPSATSALAATPTPARTPSPPPATPTTAGPELPGIAWTTAAPVTTYRVVSAYPHDPDAFTQGLVYRDGVLYEGTGLYGASSLREVDLETGMVIRARALPEDLWGEGIAVLDDRIVQLTWRSNLGLVYDRGSFEPLGQFHYPTEGWGLTHDGERFIMSDGTATLHFLDPDTYREVGRIEVRDGDVSVGHLNELEVIRGEVFANVWRTDLIARIDPDTGQVTGWVDLTGLLGDTPAGRPVDVLNGIAYDEEHDRLFVTGKLWPTLFEIALIPTDEHKDDE